MHPRLSRSLDQRRYVRMPVELPATLSVLGQGQSSARLLNITAGGALIGIFGPPPPRRSRLMLRCGTIESGAAVIWTRDREIGVEFDEPLSERLVLDQLRRSQAILSRREASLSKAVPCVRPNHAEVYSQLHAPLLTDPVRLTRSTIDGHPDDHLS